MEKEAKEQLNQETVEVKDPKKEEPKKKKSKLRKTLEWVFTGIFGVLVAILATFNIARLTNKEGYVFGYLFPQVLTDSMVPVYNVDEVIVVHQVDPSEIKVGDDVTFYYKFPEFKNEVRCTHRIKEVTVETDPSLAYKYTFIAQGVNDKAGTGVGIQVFHEDKILGKVVGKSKFFEVFYNVMKSPWSLVCLVLIPSLYLIISSILDLFKKLPDDDDKEIKAIEASKANANASKEKTESVALSSLSEKEREELKKQLLNEMLNKRGEK